MQSKTDLGARRCHIVVGFFSSSCSYCPREVIYEYIIPMAFVAKTPSSLSACVVAGRIIPIYQTEGTHSKQRETASEHRSRIKNDMHGMRDISH